MKRILFCTQMMGRTTEIGIGGGHSIPIRGVGVATTRGRTMGVVGGAAEGGGRGTAAAEVAYGQGLAGGGAVRRRRGRADVA